MTYTSKSRVFVLSALVGLVGLALAGCSSATTSAPAASTVAPTTAASTTDLTPTQESATGGNGDSGVDIQVTNFTVSQNLEVRGQFNATNNGKTTVQELTPVRIVVKRTSSETVLDASAQGGVMDMKPMAGLLPGMTRPYGFSASGGNSSAQVAEGDEVMGTLIVRIDGHEREISMPTTKVTAIRIP